jgi:hypothetical protein
MFFTRRARTYSMAASSRTPDGAFPSSWIADGNRSLWKGHECDEQGGASPPTWSKWRWETKRWRTLPGGMPAALSCLSETVPLEASISIISSSERGTARLVCARSSFKGSPVSRKITHPNPLPPRTRCLASLRLDCRAPLVFYNLRAFGLRSRSYIPSCSRRLSTFFL